KSRTAGCASDRCPSRVITGKSRNEHKISADRPEIFLHVEGDRLGQGAGARLDRRALGRRRRLVGRHRHHLCGRPLAREDRKVYLYKDHLGAHMSARLNGGGHHSTGERLAALEQRVAHVESELARMSAKVDDMHGVIMQAKGVRWALVALSGLV